MMKLTIPAVVGLLAAWVTPASAAHFKLFVLTGQSNSLGVTNGGEADPSIGSDPADAEVKFWWDNVVDATTSLGDSGGAFVSLQEQQGGYYAGSATHWGPEIEFARSLYRAGVRDFGVIKASRGGGGNTFWHKASGGHMYQHVVDTVNAATATLTANGDTFEVVGLLYLQGESDDAGEAAVAGSRFKELVDHLRTDLNGAASLHAVVGGIASPTANDDTVRANQSAIADSTAYIDDFDNLDQQPRLHDGLHFNKAAKITVGGRYAQAFLDAEIVSRHYGKLVFIGDSITQGGNGYPSYRYRVFEHLANAGVPNTAATGYEFVGSVSGAYQNNAGSTPDVNGQTFANQHDGHWGWRAFWVNGRVALPAGRYDVNNLGRGTLENWTGQTTTFETGDQGTLTYSGTTYTPDTVVMKIGINDTGTSSATQIRDDIDTLIDQLRAGNAKVRIHLCQILYSNNVAFSTVDAVNALLPDLVATKNAASSTSPVWLIDVNEGFNPGTMTYDNTHPNAAGEDFVGDRVAGGLGIIEMPDPVTVPLPLEEKAGEDLGISRIEGDDIWNTGSYANGWTAGGGITPSAVGDSDLRLNHPGGTPDVLDGTAAGWTDFHAGPWVFEARLKFDANPNGFMLWLGTGTHRILIEIHGDRTQDYGANSFNVAHDNLDGEFHTWRVEHDPAASVYHLWRDGVLLTPDGGAPYDQVGADDRLLLGDYTSGSFGNGFDVTVDRLNMGPLFGSERMHDGSGWINGWGQIGGISASIVAGGDLRVLNTSAGGSWVEGTNTGWSEGNDGVWTFEARMRFDANPNGFMIWLGTGSQRVWVEIYGDRTQDSGGQAFNVAHDNLDGEFHSWRIGHDPESGVYHVWRDGERLTPVAGAPYDSSGADERMILGDYTGGTFGNSFDVIIDAVRFDFGNAYLPPGADADGDGMSDLWEDERFGDIVGGDAGVDDDGDGSLNGEEYEADTDPLDATSRFSATIDAAGIVSVPGSSVRRVYTLWHSIDLGVADPWEEVVDAIALAGNGGELELGGGLQAESAGFYRVEVGLP